MAWGAADARANSVGPSLVMAGAMLSFCVSVVLFAFVPVNQTFWAMTFVSMVIAP
jgi:hypothetical protein